MFFVVVGKEIIKSEKVFLINVKIFNDYKEQYKMMRVRILF